MTEREKDIGSYSACNCGFFHFIEALEKVELKSEEQKKELMEIFIETSLKLYKYIKNSFLDLLKGVGENENNR